MQLSQLGNGVSGLSCSCTLPQRPRIASTGRAQPRPGQVQALASPTHRSTATHNSRDWQQLLNSSQRDRPAQCVALEQEEDDQALRHRLEELFRLPDWRSSLDWRSFSRPALGLDGMQVQLNEPPKTKPPKRPGDNGKEEDFYANAGDAIRTLRSEIPLLFQQNLSYNIYRSDIVFRDPRNTFQGIRNYKTIFWSLRFHGRIFFKRLYVEVLRIWQPDDMRIKMRWKVHGIPRVPWEAEGTFDGISEYKLDAHGKIYEHVLTNIEMRDPPMAEQRNPLFAGLSLINWGRRPAQQPIPGCWSHLQAAATQQEPAAPQAAAATETLHPSSAPVAMQSMEQPELDSLLTQVVQQAPAQTFSQPAAAQQLQQALQRPQQTQQRAERPSLAGVSAYLARFSWVRLYAAIWGAVQVSDSLSAPPPPA